mgnify:CR=1 FL=1
MNIEPKPREGVFRLYWYFASERQKIFEARLKGEQALWTTDPILQTYKFCNVFRATDRVSQRLIRAIYEDMVSYSNEDIVFNIVLFRLFSRNETWDYLCKHLGRPPLIKDLNTDTLTNALESAHNENGGLYTNAFILCANNAYGKSKKYLNHIELLRHMFLFSDGGKRLLEADSLQTVYEILHEYPLLGDFMSYQIAIDINYSDVVNFSENDFTQPGPGAIRGINKVFENLGDFSPQQTILWMANNQDYWFMKYGYEFKGLFGRPLQAIDCQGLFCEVDKYSRVALPELKSNRQKIKARFKQNPSKIDILLPPKWNLS